MTTDDFKKLSDMDKHIYIRDNFPTYKRNLSQRTKLFGVGINDCNYITQPNLEHRQQISDPCYRKWVGILERCYSNDALSRNKAYIDVEVVKEWHLFSNFLYWWEQNYVEGWVIEKDILTDNRRYGPDECVYVPIVLNSFLTTCKARRGKYMLGVGYCRPDKYIAHCHNPLTGDVGYLGYFPTEQQAHDAWLKRKLEHVEELRSLMDSIDLRIYPRIIEIVKRMK